LWPGPDAERGSARRDRGAQAHSAHC
jgi:hypothetical protein